MVAQGVVSEILSHYKPEPKTADKGLVEELDVYIRGLKGNSLIKMDIQEIINRYTPQDSLAMPKFILEILLEFALDWEDEPCCYEKGCKHCLANKAREYLNSLPDKGESK